MEPILSGKHRFRQVKKIADSLQGTVDLAKDASNNETSIIKKANKRLVRESKTYHHTHCKEDFPNEKVILYYLTNLAQCGKDHRANIHLCSLGIDFAFNTNGIAEIYDEWEDKS